MDLSYFKRFFAAEADDFARLFVDKKADDCFKTRRSEHFDY